MRYTFTLLSLVLTSFFVIPLKTTAQIADQYRSAAQAYRDAAAKTKCMDRKNAFLRLADYCNCLERSLQSGSNVTCTQPSTVIPDCPADAASSGSEDGNYKDPYGNKTIKRQTVAVSTPPATMNPFGGTSAVVDGLNQLSSAYKMADIGQLAASSDLAANGLLNVIGGLSKNPQTQQDVQKAGSAYNMAKSVGGLLGADDESSSTLGFAAAGLSALISSGNRRAQEQQQQQMKEMEEQKRAELLRKMGQSRQNILNNFSAGTTDLSEFKDLQRVFVFFIEYPRDFEQQNFAVRISSIIGVDQYQDKSWPTKETLMKHYDLNKDGESYNVETKCFGYFESVEEASVFIKRLAVQLMDAQTEIKEANVYISSRRLQNEKNKMDEAERIHREKVIEVQNLQQVYNKMQITKFPADANKSQIIVYSLLYKNELDNQAIIYTNPFTVYKLNDGSWPFVKDVLSDIQAKMRNKYGEALSGYTQIMIGYFNSEEMANKHQQTFFKYSDSQNIHKELFIYKTVPAVSKESAGNNNFWNN